MRGNFICSMKISKLKNSITNININKLNKSGGIYNNKIFHKKIEVLIK